MAVLLEHERRQAEALSRVVYCNPFLPERIAGEREALGGVFVERDAEWNVHSESEGQHLNVQRLGLLAGQLVEDMRKRIEKGPCPGEDELRLYEDAVLFHLYYAHYEALRALVEIEPERGRGQGRVALYEKVQQDLQRFLHIPGVCSLDEESAAHLFACFFQIRRAFHHIFRYIVGSSPPAVRLRADAWQSIFTHDLRRYRHSLYRKLGDFTTLITGPSGTGKELVARAVGLSRYVPFDPGTSTFAGDVMGSFHPLNLSALSPTLIESELFGHRRGSFTGALEDRAGWLETCGAVGTVFLDEVGEIDLPVQVKLLRVLETRTFQRIGDTESRRFQGKIIAATNRDLAAEMQAKRFRTDLYYRLCADMICTPSLHEQLVSAPGELERLVLFIARRVAGTAADALAAEVLSWIGGHLGENYPWPGNFRELEQCVRNVLIRGEYRPPTISSPSTSDALSDALLDSELTADELLGRYCTLVYARTGSYETASRRLGLDRRTVRKYLDPELLQELREEE